MPDINICWIIPQYTQLRLVPGKDSPLGGLVSADGEVISYDGQINYPHSTAVISTTRKLQSALGSSTRINTSILNLAAVPRNQFIDGSWHQKYLGKVHETIEFGKSIIELRKIGLEIEQVEDLDTIMQNSDLVVIPTSFETHVPELVRLARYLKKYQKKMLAAGKGVQSRETQLLEAGFDVVFVGDVTDRGEEVLLATLDGRVSALARIPGVYSNLGDREIRNLGARNFRRDKEDRGTQKQEWKLRLPRYHGFPTVSFKMVGRPDLKTDLSVDSTIEYCCAMQDLPFSTVSQLVSAGKFIVFAADDFFTYIGCPRNCPFCSAAGEGFSKRNVAYSFALLGYYKGLGATDLIPTDDQILLGANDNTKHAQNLIEILQSAKYSGFTFFYGNGLEFGTIAKLIRKSQGSCEERETYSRLLELLVATTSYIYLPIESMHVLTGKPIKPPLPKLGDRAGYESVLQWLNTKKPGIEVGTNIIYNPPATRDEIFLYYEIMDQIAKEYPKLRMRYNGFFMIPSNCAPHIAKYKRFDLSFDRAHPELKIMSVPTILGRGEGVEALEMRLAWHIQARNESHSRRRLAGGTYDDV